MDNQTQQDKEEQLLDYLVKNKLINQGRIAEIKQATSLSNKSIEDILVGRKIIELEELTKAKAKLAKLPYQNLTDSTIDDQALNTISIEAAENYKIVCFEKEKKKIKVAILEPDNFKVFEAVDFLAKEEGYQVEYYLISRASFDKAFKHYRTLNKEVTTALETRAQEEAEEGEKIKKRKVEIEETVKSAPVAKIVSVVIRHAVEGRASDIHIEPIADESRVRYRIDGVLHTSLVLPKTIHAAIVSRVKVLANLKLDETRLPQDGRIRLSVNDKEIDLRISILPLLEEEKVVMRILDVSRGAPALEELGFLGPQLKVIENNIKKTDGIFLITGPTGSGKSTTLFSVLNKINREGINISTLEDPVEYFIKGVNQTQVRPEIGFNFASGLRSLLRQDPDIIMVGEIRDGETAELAIHAGLTGHFVLSTLHTNDSLGAIPRLIDMQVEPFLLGSTLNIVIAQRLTRKICQDCKAEYNLPNHILANIKEEIAKLSPELIKELVPDYQADKLIFYKGKGCPRCGNSGFAGRIAVTEALDINDKVKDIIIDKNRVYHKKEITSSQKFISMKQDGIIKVLLGLTTIEEIIRVVHD